MLEYRVRKKKFMSTLSHPRRFCSERRGRVKMVLIMEFDVIDIEDVLIVVIHGCSSSEPTLDICSRANMFRNIQADVLNERPKMQANVHACMPGCNGICLHASSVSKHASSALYHGPFTDKQVTNRYVRHRRRRTMIFH